MGGMVYKLVPCKQQLLILGKTQADIAREVGTSRVIVNKFFNGRGIRPGMAKAIIEALGLQVQDVIARRVAITPRPAAKASRR